MARRLCRLWLGVLIVAVSACAKPDSVELGGQCSQSVECKDPADTCMTLMAESLCTVACSADKACPDDYACARMDVRVEGADGSGKADAAGYCLAKSRLGPNVATIKPKGSKGKKGKSKRSRRNKSKRRSGAKAKASAQTGQRSDPMLP